MTTVNVPIISVVRLDEESNQIINSLDKRQKSHFIRQAIVSFATRWGFIVPSDRPHYMHPRRWEQVQKAQQKSRRVNYYSYVTAYHYLKSRFPYLGKSEIIREAIKAYQ